MNTGYKSLVFMVLDFLKLKTMETEFKIDDYVCLKDNVPLKEGDSWGKITKVDKDIFYWGTYYSSYAYNLRKMTNEEIMKKGIILENSYPIY